MLVQDINFVYKSLEFQCWQMLNDFDPVVFECVCAIFYASVSHFHGELHTLLFMVREESVVDQHSSSSVAKSMVSTMLDDLPKTTGSQTSRQRDEPKPEKVIHKYGFVITVYPNETGAALQKDESDECDHTCDECEKSSDKSDACDQPTGEGDECEKTPKTPVVDATATVDDEQPKTDAATLTIEEEWPEKRWWNPNEKRSEDWWWCSEWQCKESTGPSWRTTPIPNVPIHQSKLSERADPSMWPSRPSGCSNGDFPGPDSVIWQLMQDQQQRHTQDLMHLLGNQQQQQQQQQQQHLLLYRQLQHEQQQQHFIAGTVHERPCCVGNTQNDDIVHHGWIC